MAGVEDAKDAALAGLGVDPGKVSLDDLEALDALFQKIATDPVQGTARVAIFKVSGSVADDVWAAVKSHVTNSANVLNVGDDVTIISLWEGAPEQEPALTPADAPPVK